MMSARKKQGLPPVKKGAQPRIRIRPHTGRKKQSALPPVAPLAQPQKSLNDRVLQRPAPKVKKDKIIKKQNVATRTKSVHAARAKTLLQGGMLAAALMVTGVIFAAVWSIGGAVYALGLLAVLGIGGAVWSGGHFYSRLLQDQKRLQKEYEKLVQSTADNRPQMANMQQGLPDAVTEMLKDRPETLSTDAEPRQATEQAAASFAENLRVAAGTAYAATGTTAMAQRLKPVDEVIDFKESFNVGEFADWSDAKVLRCVQEAIARERIDMFIQPIVQLPQRKRRFYEMYSRIRIRPDVYLPAERYIPLARQDGILSEIDNRLLLRALQLIQTADEGNLNRSFFCNISPFTLNDQKFMADLLEFLTQNRLLAPRLVFELAQDELTALDPATVKVLDGLSRLGCRFAMDGVTSLDFDFDKIQACHIRYAKVSEPVLMRALSGPGGFTQVRRMKDAFSYHGIDFIVEKIESERQLVEFLDIHAEYGQGYLFGEPRKWSPDKGNQNIT